MASGHADATHTHLFAQHQHAFVFCTAPGSHSHSTRHPVCLFLTALSDTQPSANDALYHPAASTSTQLLEQFVHTVDQSQRSLSCTDCLHATSTDTTMTSFPMETQQTTMPAIGSNNTLGSSQMTADNTRLHMQAYRNQPWHQGSDYKITCISTG